MNTNNENVWASEVLEKCMEKYVWVAEKHKDGFPYTTDETGTYDNRADQTKEWIAADGLNWWTNGFWGGILWQIYAQTGNERMAEIARYGEVLMDKCFDDYYGLHHDVGFMWLPTAIANYKITGDLEGRRRGMHAANLLAGRFNPVGKYIRAWNGSVLGCDDTSGWAIIDCMLNIPLLYWASKETGDPRFAHIAMMHADTVKESFIREDGSSNHIVDFDSRKGGVVQTFGGQGYENGSAWTRGQGWALYGFIVSFKETGKVEYLETAMKIANFALSKMPESGLIPVDFCQPAEPALEDSCGAAIIACGLLELAAVCGEEGKKGENRVSSLQASEIAGLKYEEAALKILHALDSHRSIYDDSCDAILTHCTSSYHGVESRHITMVYADYYYIEALRKVAYGTLTKDSPFMW